MATVSAYEIDLIEPEVARYILGLSPDAPGFRRLARRFVTAATVAIAAAALLCCTLGGWAERATNPGLFLLGLSLGTFAAAVLVAWSRATFCPHCGALAPAPAESLSRWCRGCQACLSQPRTTLFAAQPGGLDCYEELIRALLLFAAREHDCLGLELQGQETELRSWLIVPASREELEPAPGFVSWPAIQVLQAACALAVAERAPQRGRLSITTPDGLSTRAEVSVVGSPSPRARVLFERAASSAVVAPPPG